MVVQHVALINKLCRFDFLCVYQLSLSLETNADEEFVREIVSLDKVTQPSDHTRRNNTRNPLQKHVMYGYEN